MYTRNQGGRAQANAVDQYGRVTRRTSSNAHANGANRSKSHLPSDSARNYSRDRYQNISASRKAADAQGGSLAYVKEKMSSGGTAGHSVSHKKKAQAKKHRSRLITVVVALVLIAAGVGAFLWFFPPVYNITVDGKSVSVPATTTLQNLVEGNFASPKAGNLIAVDGSVAKEGGGDPFEATINDEQTNNPQAHVKRDAVITFSDGNNVDESYTETVSSVPFGTSTQTATPASYYQGSIHLYSEGQDGQQSKRTGDVSGKTVTVVTKQPVNAGFSTSSVNVGTDKVIALTFDDGPWPETSEEILNILEQNDAHATFFMIGNQVGEHPDVVKKLYAAGNQLATHSYDHAAGAGQGVNLTYMTADQQVSEITKGFDAIESVIGAKVSRIMRAPGGNYYGSLVETLHPYITAEIGWDVDTEDWRKPGSEAIIQRIESVKPGQVILCHDGGGNRSQTVEALKVAIPYLKAQGYTFITIDELLAYRTSGTSTVKSS